MHFGSLPQARRRNADFQRDLRVLVITFKFYQSDKKVCTSEGGARGRYAFSHEIRCSFSGGTGRLRRNVNGVVTPLHYTGLSCGP